MVEGAGVFPSAVLGTATAVTAGVVEAGVGLAVFAINFARNALSFSPLAFTAGFTGVADFASATG